MLGTHKRNAQIMNDFFFYYGRNSLCALEDFHILDVPPYLLGEF